MLGVADEARLPQRYALLRERRRAQRLGLAGDDRARRAIDVLDRRRAGFLRRRLRGNPADLHHPRLERHPAQLGSALQRGPIAEHHRIEGDANLKVGQREDDHLRADPQRIAHRDGHRRNHSLTSICALLRSWAR